MRLIYTQANLSNNVLFSVFHFGSGLIFVFEPILLEFCFFSLLAVCIVC